MQSRLGWKAHNICTVEESGPVFICPPCKPTLYIVLCNFRRFRNLLQFGSTKLLHLCGSSLIPPSGLLHRHCSFSCAAPVFKPRRRLCLCPPPASSTEPPLGVDRCAVKGHCVCTMSLLVMPRAGDHHHRTEHVVLCTSI